MNPQDVCDAFKEALNPLPGVQVYSHMPPSPNLPALIIYPQQWPYDVTAEKTIAVWCVAGEVESQGAQAQLNAWLAEEGDSSVYAAILADQSLGGKVATVLPFEIRNWGIVSMADGRRVVQAEILFEVWRFA